MIRLCLALALALACMACNRPSEAKCKEAVDNIFALTGAAENPASAPDEQQWIRSCRANATKDTVNCYIAAKTIEQLGQCEGDLGKKMAEKEAAEAAAKAKEQPAGEGGN